jgi:hypothetical protein
MGTTSAINILEGHKRVESIFTALVCFQPGRGDIIKFWHDNWLRGIRKYEFPNLFAITLQSDESVAAHFIEGQW